jgi:hypothetical protein
MMAASLAMELAALPPLRLRRKTSGVSGRHAFALALLQVAFAPVAQAIDTQRLGEDASNDPSVDGPVDNEVALADQSGR